MTKHSMDIRIYYEDTDAGGVVYHARYLAFAERARTEALRGQSINVEKLAREEKICFVVTKASILYKRPLRLDDMVSVTTSLESLQGATCSLLQVFSWENTVFTNIDITLACLDIKTMRPMRIPEQCKQALLALT